MENEKPGFYIWFTTTEAMTELTFEEKGMIFTAAVEYARDGIIPTFDDRLLRSVWAGVKADLDNDDQKYKKNQNDSRIKGWKSYFKRIYAPANGIDPNDEDAMEVYVQQRLTTVDNGGQQPTNTTHYNTTHYSTVQNSTVQNSTNKPTTPTRSYGEYENVYLTDEELSKLQAEFPGDWKERIERLSEYIESTGKRYKSHLATIRSWAKKDSETERKTPISGNPCDHITLDDYMNDSEHPW